MDNPSFSGKEADIPANVDDVTMKAYKQTGDDFTKDGSHESDKAKIDLTMSDEEAQMALEPYAGMGKDDLLRFSQTPFWSRLRLVCIILFWCAWIGLLTAVVVLTIVTDRCDELQPKTWWEKSTVYQIYVRSFYDSDANSVGDIKGVIEKLDYLHGTLGVSSILLSSIYLSNDGSTGTSPVERDFGYDIIDHKAIDPELGTMEDFRLLVQEAHKQGLRVLLDFVPNHTSDQHEWFEFSKSSDATSNDYWNYYVWEPAENDDCAANPPSNWRSYYGGSAWKEADSAGRDDCYLHQFFEWQPELNLRSERVRQEMEAILRFWLDEGVDGFRVKNAKYLYEDADLRDNDEIPSCDGVVTDDYHCMYPNFTSSQSETYDLIAAWRSIVEEYSTEECDPEEDDDCDPSAGDKVLITDAEDETVEEIMKYYGQNNNHGASFPINYELTQIDRDCDGYCVHDLVMSWLDVMPEEETANWLTGNQDITRVAEVMEDDFVNAILMMKFTLPGAVLTYYGEELGLIDGPANTNLDPAGFYSETWSRDPYRGPMQWTSGNYSGFVNESAIEGNYEPWLPVMNYTSVQEQDEGDSYTHLNMYKRLVELHDQEEGLQHGDVSFRDTNYPDIFAYQRNVDGRDRFLCAFNFGNQSVTVSIGCKSCPDEAECLLTSSGDMSFSPGDEVDLQKVYLEPGDGAIFSWPYTR